MKNIVFGLMGVVFSLPSFAQSIDAPSVKAGDSWIYRTTVEKGPTGWGQSRSEVTVSHVTSSSIYYSTKQSGSTQAPNETFAGADWSRSRDVNGKETVVNKPLSFPLSAGKTWEIQYTEQHPNKAHRFEQWNNKFTVIGFETVEVPAGKFKAIKIEEEGRWNAEMEPGQSVVQGAQVGQGGTTMVTQIQKTTALPATGRTYKAFWYVPEVKRWVKSVEEYYGNGGVRTERYSGELESFKLSE
ncbi:hypothetical protein [Collimonas sp.]|jgi:hypothetical protein|uniref:hypothetical protein n=1 Tax=Collimonas sp. TaxID=1963772 RepID=UPI002CF0889E|nr:hypothetical protein [Collimonas sp.]HWW07849.1 hypothetical protein [Collimonas sp.]